MSFRDNVCVVAVGVVLCRRFRSPDQCGRGFTHAHSRENLMEQNVDVERLNRHLSELAWAPTVEISRAELVAVLSRLEQAEQAVQRVREMAAEYRPSIPEEVLHEVMKDILRALDGEQS